MDPGNSQDQWIVVVNNEEQYSVWPADVSKPAGWNQVTEARSRPDCLAFIETIWLDITPLSVRNPLKLSDELSNRLGDDRSGSASNRWIPEGKHG